MTASKVNGPVLQDIIRGLGVTVCIFGIALSVPLLGFFVSLLLPLPVMFYRSKLGRRWGAMIPVVSFFLMSVLFGRVSLDLIFFAELMLCGFVMAELINADYSLEKTILYACGIVVAAGYAVLFFYAGSRDMGVAELVDRNLAANLDLSFKIYTELGVFPEENIQLIKDSLDRIRYVLLRMAPAITVSFLMVVMWMTLLISRVLFQLRNLYFPDYGPLKFWRAPENLVWGVIGCGVVMIFPDSSIKMIGANGLLILMTIYFFSGIGVIAFYFEKFGLPRPLRIFSYAIIMLHQIALIFVIGIGFFDIWINFRKRGLSGNNDQ